VWLYERIERLFIDANVKFGYRLTGFVDPILLAEYPPGVGFDWHLDTVTGVTSTRKISVTIPLSEGTEYEGGRPGDRPVRDVAGVENRGERDSLPLLPLPSCHADHLRPTHRDRRLDARPHVQLGAVTTPRRSA
jgi:hypothetical protein